MPDTPSPAPPDRQGEFVQQLTGSQDWLRAFVRALVIESHAADDVLQRVNLVLWQKADEFTPGTNFRAWACRVARFEALAFHQERRRDRHLFRESLIEKLASDAEQELSELSDYRERLTHCLQKLTPEQRALVAERYSDTGSVQQIAAREGRTADAVSASLYRIRRLLWNCLKHEPTR